MRVRSTLLLGLIGLLLTFLILLASNSSTDARLAENDDLFLFYNCPERDLARICKYDLSEHSEEIILESSSDIRFSDRDMLEIGANRILFRCLPDASHNYIFCTMDFDGKNIEKFEARVIPDVNPPDVGYNMNEQGDIIFLCSPYHQISIEVVCLIDQNDPNGFRVLSPEGFSVFDMDLNDHGDVIFSCLNLFRPARELRDFSGPFNMCAINIDGSNFRVLSPDFMWVSDAHVSESRDFIFFCTAPFETEESQFNLPDYDICKVDQAGHLERNVKPRSATTLYLDAVGENRLAYWCTQPIAGDDEEKIEYGFCRTTFDGSDYDFTPISINALNGYYAFSKTGLIAMACDLRPPPDTSRGTLARLSDICIVDAEGNEIARISEPPLLRVDPIFNH